MTLRLRPHAPHLAAALLAAALPAACAPAARTPARPAPAGPSFPFGGAGRADSVAPGVVHEAFVVREGGGRGRWAVHVVRAAPGACVAARKAGGAAVGRATTSAIAAGRAARDSAARDSASRDSSIVAAVNADFFSFTPPGVPVSGHVERGRVIAGPTTRPVFAVDSAGRPWIGQLATVGGLVRDGADTLPVSAWNRGADSGVTVFDAGWGVRTDSAAPRLFVRMHTDRRPDAGSTGGPGAPVRYRVGALDTGAVTGLRPGSLVVAVGADAPEELRARWAALRPGNLLDFAVALAPVRPREAVGGQPVLVRAGAVTADVDTVGSATFRGPNPRTAVGITADGGLLLVTIDGRQPGHSDGATLRETAELMRALGAVTALNLDGGGSTTMVVRDSTGRLGVVNRPSDAEGERPVANALAVRSCAAP